MANASPVVAKSKTAPAIAAAAAKSAVKSKSATVAKQEKVELVTLRQIADSVSEEHGISHKQAIEVLSSAIALMTSHLKKGARIRIAGLGTLEVRKRAARMGRNPATGEAIKIKASKKVAFRAAKDLSEAI
jgi:DNA-binding protein HU-beta